MASKIPPQSEKQHPIVIHLRRLGQMFPDFQEVLFRAGQKIHKQSTTSDLTKRTLVTEAVRAGCNAVGDLVDETGLEPGDVRRIWRELLEDGKYEERLIGLEFKVGKKPPKGLFLKGTIAGSDYSPARYQRPYENPDAGDDDEF